MMSEAFATGRMRSKRCAGAGASQSQTDSIRDASGGPGRQVANAMRRACACRASAGAELALQIAELLARRRGVDESRGQKRSHLRHQRFGFVVRTACGEQRGELNLGFDRRVRVLADAGGKN